jgi:rhodanese-related sulfurtransferase
MVKSYFIKSANMKVLSTLFLLLCTCLTFAQERTAEPLTFAAFEQKLKATKSPQILDVRSPSEFAENHLEQAINFYTTDDDSFAKASKTLKKNEPVFIYSINAGRSNTVAKKLRAIGFTEVYPMPGGLAQWIGAGNPIVSNGKKGLSITDYEQTISTENIVLVDVGSKHCGGCKRLDPIVTSVSDSTAIRLVKLDLYENRELAKSLDIQAVPTLILYKNNKPVWRKSGAISKNEIVAAINETL